MALTADDKKWISAEIKETVNAALVAWGKIDPVRTTYNRSGFLANDFAPEVKGEIDSLLSVVAEIKNILTTQPRT